MIKVAYVISTETDNFAWYALNEGDEHLVDRQIVIDFDDGVEIDWLSEQEANEMTDDVPSEVQPGTLINFYYGS